MRDAHLDKDPRRIDVTWEDLRDIFIDQQACCYWFGFELDPDGIFTSYNPLAISADRIDDDRGYVKGNIVICSRMANLGRGKCPAHEFQNICDNLKNSIITDWQTTELIGKFK